MTFALIFIVCFRPDACAPILAGDGLPSLVACQMAGMISAPQAPAPVKHIICIDSRRVGAILGRHEA